MLVQERAALEDAVKRQDEIITKQEAELERQAVHIKDLEGQARDCASLRENTSPSAVHGSTHAYLSLATLSIAFSPHSPELVLCLHPACPPCMAHTSARTPQPEWMPPSHISNSRQRFCPVGQTSSSLPHP